MCVNKVRAANFDANPHFVTSALLGEPDNSGIPGIPRHPQQLADPREQTLVHCPSPLRLPRRYRHGDTVRRRSGDTFIIRRGIRARHRSGHDGAVRDERSLDPGFDASRQDRAGSDARLERRTPNFQADAASGHVIYIAIGRIGRCQCHQRIEPGKCSRNPKAEQWPDRDGRGTDGTDRRRAQARLQPHPLTPGRGAAPASAPGILVRRIV